MLASDLSRHHEPGKFHMRKFIDAAAIIGMTATTLYAQFGANPSAPLPGSTGVGVKHDTTSTGTAVDRPISGTNMPSGGMANDGMKKDDVSKGTMPKHTMSKDNMKM
jgi:hypothetical protein